MPIVSYGDTEKVQRSWAEKAGATMEKYVEYDDDPLYMLSCCICILQRKMNLIRGVQLSLLFPLYLSLKGGRR